MANLINTFNSTGPKVYYTDKFRRMIEDHLHILKNKSKNNIRLITQNEWAQLYRYQGDFYGLFRSLGFDDKYHWTMLRLNGYRSRLDLGEELEYLLIPDFDYVDQLARYCKQK